MVKRAKSQEVQRLEAEVRNLRACQEAFYCLRLGLLPVAISSGEGEDERRVELLGPARASGGVVIIGASVYYATDWLIEARASVDPYLREVARLVEHAQTAAIKARMGSAS